MTRQTEDLIAALAAAPAPRRRSDLPLAALTIAAILGGLAAYYATYGLRDGLGAALAVPLTFAKFALPVLIALLALPTVLRIPQPEARVTLWPLAIPAVIALLLFASRSISSPDFGTEIMGQTAAACLLSITALSLVPVATGIALVSRGAPQRPVQAGALVGLTVGALVTAGYALHCPEDSPLFYVLWYGLGICAATGMGAALGRRYLRW